MRKQESSHSGSCSTDSKLVPAKSGSCAPVPTHACQALVSGRALRQMARLSRAFKRMAAEEFGKGNFGPRSTHHLHLSEPFASVLRIVVFDEHSRLQSDRF
eukprot:975095-Rhodomonas_salina.1